MDYRPLKGVALIIGDLKIYKNQDNSSRAKVTPMGLSGLCNFGCVLLSAPRIENRSHLPHNPS